MFSTKNERQVSNLLLNVWTQAREAFVDQRAIKNIHTFKQDITEKYCYIKISH